ncbi:TIR domain-containing protein [Sorangium sp. So ce341]|uniref:TIR domain-containing protein n=1 Tax=Sorangium sp. So ce341 TaxID=3133302 RepID=UPI003F5E897A
MATDSARRHLFISHHHEDDGEVTKLNELLTNHGYDVRNSSIRVNPANEHRLEQKLVSDEAIRRLLRLKISWATTVVVLIGKETHERPWVNWEIEEAHRQGKRIVGVYVRGGTEADVPVSFEKYGTALVGWNTDRIMSAIDGDENVFQNPDGSTRPSANDAVRSQC